MHPTPRSLVVVVVPVYNVRPYLRATIESVLVQTHSNLRLVVVDDGSSDGSMSAIADIDDERLLRIEQANAGVSVARNRGWHSVDGDAYAFLDSDDTWHPEKIERTLPLLEDHAAAGTRMRYIGERGKGLPAYAGSSPSTDDAQRRIRNAQLMPFPLSSILFRADAIAEAGPFDTELRRSQDVDFLARVADVGPIGWVDEVLGAYRLRGSAASAADQVEQRLVWRYVMARKAARAEGRTLALAEFRQTYTLSHADRRHEESVALYRRGGLLLAGRDVRGLALLVRAAVRSPRYVIRRVDRQLRGSASR